MLRPTPVLGDLAPRVTRVVPVGEHGCALLEDQSVRCWGDDRFGQLAVGSTGAGALAPTEPSW